MSAGSAALAAPDRLPPDIDEATLALMAIRAVTDLLLELPDMHVINPENLNALLSIVADRLEAALNI